MTAVGLDRIDDLGTDFFGQGCHLVMGQLAHIGRLVHAIEDAVHNAPLAKIGPLPMVPAL